MKIRFNIYECKGDRYMNMATTQRKFRRIQWDKK
jgi:hypothetical protein